MWPKSGYGPGLPAVSYSTVMAPNTPSYASQFKYLSLSFPFDNVLHVVLNRSDARYHTNRWS
jgi:hypothetical protein